MTGPEGFGGVLVLGAADYRRNRALWLKARRSGLGASETAAVLGLTGRWKTALDVYLEKTSATDPADSKTSDAAAMGQELESFVGRLTVKRRPDLGKLVPTPGLLAHPDYPWMLATVDYGLAPRGKRGAPVRALLEVKTTSFMNYRDSWVDGVPPAAVQVQCQQQLAVTGLDEAWVTCFVGGDGGPGRLAEPFLVKRSPEVIEQIIHYGGLWWADHVQARKRPDPAFDDLDKLAGLFPADDSLEPLISTPELESVIADLIDAKRRIKEAQAAEDRAKFKLETAMAERTAIATPAGDVLVTWKESAPRKVLDQKALAADHPDLVAQYRRPADKPSRPLLVKDLGGKA